MFESSIRTLLPVVGVRRAAVQGSWMAFRLRRWIMESAALSGLKR